MTDPDDVKPKMPTSPRAEGRLTVDDRDPREPTDTKET